MIIVFLNHPSKYYIESKKKQGNVEVHSMDMAIRNLRCNCTMNGREAKAVINVKNCFIKSQYILIRLRGSLIRTESIGKS